MVGTIICEVGTIMCDIDTINVRFYLLKVRFPHEYRRITLLKIGFNNYFLYISIINTIQAPTELYRKQIILRCYFRVSNYYNP